jgi:uncharacterized protein (UPF0216 family)
MANFNIHDHVKVLNYIGYEARKSKIAAFAGKKGMVVSKGSGWIQVNFHGLGTHGFRNYELEKTDYAGPRIESAVNMRTYKKKSFSRGTEVLVERTDIKKNKHLEGQKGRIVHITGNNMYVLRMPDGEDYYFKRDGIVELDEKHDPGELSEYQLKLLIKKVINESDLDVTSIREITNRVVESLFGTTSKWQSDKWTYETVKPLVKQMLMRTQKTSPIRRRSKSKSPIPIRISPARRRSRNISPIYSPKHISPKHISPKHISPKHISPKRRTSQCKDYEELSEKPDKSGRYRCLKRCSDDQDRDLITNRCRKRTSKKRISPTNLARIKTPSPHVSPIMIEEEDEEIVLPRRKSPNPILARIRHVSPVEETEEEEEEEIPIEGESPNRPEFEEPESDELSVGNESESESESDIDIPVESEDEEDDYNLL